MCTRNLVFIPDTPVALSTSAIMPKTYELSEFRVLLLGACLLVAGWAGFFYIPGMMAEDAQGSKAVNAFYCSAVTLTT